MEKIIWTKNIISKILKAELAKRGLGYNEMVEKLGKVNMEITPKDLRNRISKGTVSSLLFVQCLYAMGISNLQLEQVYFEEDTKPEKLLKKDQISNFNVTKTIKSTKKEDSKQE